MLRGSAAPSSTSTTNPFVLTTQVVTAGQTLTSSSPYATVVNSASANTINLPASPSNGEVKVVGNVGAGTVTVGYTGRAGATTKTLAQDNSATFQYIAGLNYWIIE